MKRICILVAVLLVAGSLWAQEHDLTVNIWYFRQGFSTAWIDVVPAATDPAWYKVEYPNGKRTMLIRELKIPGVRRGSAWNPFPGKIETVTVLIPFVVQQEILDLPDPALFLRFVGQSWAVYLNGVLIQNEIKPTANGGYVQIAQRNVVIPLDKKLLVDGANMLALQLIGDPGDNRMGFALRGPYKVGSYHEYVQGNLDALDSIIIAVYAIFGLYNLIMFFLRSKDRGYLFLGTATILLSVYLLTRTNLLIGMLKNSLLVSKIEYASMLGIPIFFFGFFELLMQGKLSKRWWYILWCTLALLVPGLIFREEPFIAVWRILAVLVGFYYVIFVIGKTVGRDILKLANELAEEGIGGFAGAFKWFFLESDSGKIIAGTIVFLITISLDIFRAMQGDLIFWTKYGFAFFLLGAASLLASRFINIHAEMEQLKVGLNRLVDERTEALAKTTDELSRLNTQIDESSTELKVAMKEAARDLKIAASVQRGFFGGKAPVLENWDIAVRYLPAQSLSGDFYDFYTPGKDLAGLIIGSVSGKSVASGLLTVLTRHIGFRIFKENSAKPMSQYVYAYNKALVREYSSVDNHVLCSFLRFSKSEAEYVNAGMPDALLLRGTEARTLKPEDDSIFRLPPLARNQIEGDIRVLKIALAAGDILVLASPGFATGTNPRGEQYGIDRVRESLRKSDKESAETILLSLLADYRNFITQQVRPGDCTLIVLRKKA